MAATIEQLRPVLATLRAQGYSERECLDHSPAWLQEHALAASKVRQDEHDFSHRQGFSDLLIGVNLAVSAANGSEEAGRRIEELMDEMAGGDDWFVDSGASGYDMDKIKAGGLG